MADKATPHPSPVEPPADGVKPPPVYDAGQQYPPQVMAEEYHPAPSHMYGQTTASHVTVVQQQPFPATQVEYGPKPSNYLGLSILNLICCCFILGVIALVFSLQVDSAWSSQRYNEARQNSNTAKILNIVGLVIGIIAWAITGVIVVINLIVFFVALGTANSYDTSTNTDYPYSG